jgi:hypothetical protein
MRRCTAHRYPVACGQPPPSVTRANAPYTPARDHLRIRVAAGMRGRPYFTSTTAISSSVSPYNSYTSASAFSVALKRGLDVRRLLDYQKVTGTLAVPATWKTDHTTCVVSSYLIHQNCTLPSPSIGSNSFSLLVARELVGTAQVATIFAAQTPVPLRMRLGAKSVEIQDRHEVNLVAEVLDRFQRAQQTIFIGGFDGSR